MKNKLKCGLTLAALTFLVGCSDKGSIQRPNIGGGSTAQDSSSIFNSESTNSNTSDATSDSTSSEIDPVGLSNYQYYPLPDKTWAIAVGNNKYLEMLTLPEQYQGRKVTQIAENGFKDCKALREISIPSSVLTVGNCAFSGCYSLAGIVIPNSVTTIGDGAFSGCTSLTSIVIPEGVTTIGDGAFLGCSALSNITIPNSVTAIRDSTFQSCSSLTGIVIPEGVTSIGDSAFSICTSLTGIVIPEGVTAISGYAFSGCASLTSIVIPNSVTNIGYSAFYDCSRLTVCCKARSKPSGWSDSWNCSDRPVVWGCIRAGNQDCFEYAVTNIEGVESATIIGYTGSDTSITVPETIGGAKVTAIADSAFKGRSSLKGIVIPEGVTNIGDCAFLGCSALSNITIPNSVTAIRNSTFYDCFSLTGIVIPEGVTSIGDSAFLRCVSLTSIVIPNSVTSIGYSAFWGCSSLTICCKARSEPSGWDSRWNDSGRPVIWECSGIGTSGSLNYRIDYKNGEESITITRCAGADSEAVIPETIGGVKVTTIADSAFKGRSSLTSIVIPDSVTSIGNSAFSRCSSLTGIVIPEGVTTIGDYAFWGCSNLTICCKARSKPSGWSDSWNCSDRPVVWGYSGNGTSGSLN